MSLKKIIMKTSNLFLLWVVYFYLFININNSVKQNIFHLIVKLFIVDKTNNTVLQIKYYYKISYLIAFIVFWKKYLCVIVFQICEFPSVIAF